MELIFLVLLLISSLSHTIKLKGSPCCWLDSQITVRKGTSSQKSLSPRFWEIAPCNGKKGRKAFKRLKIHSYPAPHPPTYNACVSNWQFCFRTIRITSLHFHKSPLLPPPPLKTAFRALRTLAPEIWNFTVSVSCQCPCLPSSVINTGLFFFFFFFCFSFFELRF